MTNMNREIEKELGTGDMLKLYQVLAELDDPQSVAKLLRDLLTLEELQEIGRRFTVAQRLSKRETQRSIAADTGVSTATVSRVNSWLHHGTGGYGLALQCLRES
jgi:TrpR-related protein YerC/YecD